MPRAAVSGVVLAESDHTEMVEDNHYTVEAEGERAEDAAWYDSDPKYAAKNIKDPGAFYGDRVRVEG